MGINCGRQLEEKMTSGLYIAYELGYTCATMGITMGCYIVK